MNKTHLVKWAEAYWKFMFVLIIPIIFVFIPALWSTTEARCAYVIIIMAAYWMTEALPISITALIPVFAFPLLGIMSTTATCLVYMKPTNMMFLGGLMVAIAIEHCNLHKRIALFVILRVGQSPRRLMAGFMLTTMFLSMWISNTATTAMMVPIVNAILNELYPKNGEKENVTETTGIEMEPRGQENIGYDPEIISSNGIEKASETEISIVSTSPPSDNEKDRDTEGHDEVDEADQPGIENASEIDSSNEDVADQPGSERYMMTRALFLGVAYSANIGGTGVVTGTAPNLVMMSILSNSFESSTGLNFATWIAFNVPGMLICVVLAWLWLQFLFLGLFRKNKGIKKSTPESETAVKNLISAKYKELGKMTQHEITVLILFLSLVMLWFFRNPEFIDGWATQFTYDYKIGDATPAMFIVFLLFALPSKFELPWIQKPDDEMKSPPACLSWEALHEKVPWNVVLLLGGGFAMAEAAKTSGLSAFLGVQFESLQILPKEAIVLVVCLMIAMLTEVASNTATASVLLPVLQEMALNINVNPLYLMLPAAVCCSYAFMLPVATAPNAIVFSVAKMKSTEMMKAGFVMNVICVLVMTVMINSLGLVMFDLHSFPAWAQNATITT